MLSNLRLSLLALGVFVCGLVLAQHANAALTFSATTISSDANLILSPTSNLGIGNANPQALLHLGTAGTRSGIIKMDGSTSGTITIQPAAAAGTWTFTLPTSGGTNGQVLTTNGSGVTSWTTAAGGGVTNSAAANVIPKSDGTNLVASRIRDDGTNVLIDVANHINDTFQAGDLNNAFGGARITVDPHNIYLYGADPAQSQLTILNDGTFKAQTTGTFSAGDVDNTTNGTKLVVSDAAQNIEAIASAIKINSLGGTTTIGDADDNNNGTKIVVDDSSSNITVVGFLFAETIIPPTIGSLNNSLGTNSRPWDALYMGTAVTNNIKITTATATAARTVTLPDASGIVQLSSTTAFANLPTCNSTTDGMIRGVNNSNTVTWGATIAGGGSNHVLAFCNGTAWTVAGK